MTINYLSIDFESWTYPNIPNFHKLSGFQRKKLDAGYIKKSAHIILKLLTKYNIKITFFIVAQLYDWYPDIIEQIASEGHEIAYHTYSHDILYSEKELISSLSKSKRFLQRFKPIGFRAPAIIFKTEYLKILAQHGFLYDSSVYGTYSQKKKHFGVTEIPVSSFLHAPVGSGYFLGFLGKHVKILYHQIQKKGDPLITFVHNWQIVKPKDALFPNAKYLLTHPQYFPYSLEISKEFEYILQNYKFAHMKQLIKH